jgi:uncharacterized damage-inducible protein DinB
MELKQRIKWQLETFRQFGEQFFSAFKTPQDWTYEIFPGANHALWIIGHLSMVDNNVLSRLFPGKGVDKPDYSEKFGRQSKPSPNAADYPPPEEVLAFFHERRIVLLECIDNMSAEDFEQPVPPPKPPFINNVWQLLSFMAIHESLHMGQLSMCRRALGNAPIV